MSSGSGTSRRGFLAATASAPLALTATSPAFARQENGQIAADLERYVGFGIKASGGSGDEACGAWLEEELAAAGFETERQYFDAPFFEEIGRASCRERV